MPHALVTSRDGRDEDVVHRFDPRFWTVNFPRPAMASVATTAPDALRVDLAWHQSDALVGLIWESADRLSPPLIAYEESRDYAHTRLTFRWRSSGCRALDVLNGPVLTVEGLDEAGQPCVWYVRLWNHAVGTPADAVVTLDFDALDGGYLLPAEAERVWPHAIERMFVSLTPDGSGPTGWAEMSGIRCQGSGAVLTVGDALVPPHTLRLATAYDDSFNQTPERLLRAALHLGYRRELLHYVGMSHFMALEGGSGAQKVSPGSGLCEPARAWHADYLSRAKAHGTDLILSLSFELFDAYCPEAWKQRDALGQPALTGWEPPSTLLSPANGEAMEWLAGIARAFVTLARVAGQPVRFQIGEPWWWTKDGRLHAHDAATRALVSDAPDDVRGPQSEAARAALDRLGALLSAATARVADAVRAEDAAAELLLLVYLPTVLDEATPELKRANVPVGWASPSFDVLQLEDYDWVTEDRPDRSRAGFSAMAERLGYPPARTHYLSGFVLRAEDAPVQWPLIERAAEAARPHAAARFVWALPQVARDGFVHFETKEEPVRDFDDIRFPIAIGQHASVTSEHGVSVVESASGHEHRNADWAGARLRFDVGPGVRSEADVARLMAFFRARRGPARAFRLADPFDSTSADAPGRAVSAIDQPLGTGDGERARFALVKGYGDGADRRITCPVAGSVVVALDGVPVGGWSLEPGGEVLFAAAPPAGMTVTAGYEFDVPIRFASDRLEVARATVLAGEIASVPLVEVRE